MNSLLSILSWYNLEKNLYDLVLIGLPTGAQTGDRGFPAEGPPERLDPLAGSLCFAS